MDRTQALLSSPLQDVLTLSKVKHLRVDYRLERTYTLTGTKRVLKALKANPGRAGHLAKLDHNKVLDLYPEFEYIFGPYTDCDAEHCASVYFLYTNHINEDNELRVVYAGRVLKEHDLARRLEGDESFADEGLYERGMEGRAVLTDKLSNHCYYRPMSWSGQQRQALRQLYQARSVGEPVYNRNRENFVAHLTLASGAHTVNIYRLLLELKLQRRLEAHEVATPINGKKADLREDNVCLRDLDQEDKDKREKALTVYGLDTVKLKRIYAKEGYNCFRGIYRFNEDGAQKGLQGRLYVKLVKGGTEQQTALLLSRALMTVKYDRILGDDETVDHIDQDSHNDRIDNLRVVSRTQHTAEDSVRVEVDPVKCSCCGKDYYMSDAEFFYCKNTPSALIYCSPQCRAKLKVLTPERRSEMAKAKVITYRYYVANKGGEGRLYFPHLDYEQCRQHLFKEGRANLSPTPY